MKHKVLIVEDEVSLRELYADILVDGGYEVSEAGDGDFALTLINEGKWDILLLDIMLPKLDGIEVLKSISGKSEFKDKPVVVLSNLDNDQITSQCLALGAKEFIVKSNFEPSIILLTVNKYLADIKEENDGGIDIKTDI